MNPPRFLALVFLLALPHAAQGQAPATFAEAAAAFEATAGKSQTVRAQALNALTEFKTAECVRYLDALRLRASKRFLRSLCLRHIGTVGVDPARQILESVLERGRADVQPSALIGLSRLRPRVPSARFLKVLATTGAELRARHAAVRVLAGYPEEPVADALARELLGNPPWFRNTVVAALRAIVGKEPCAGWLVTKGLAKAPRYKKAVEDLLRVASACPRPELPALIRPRVKRGKLPIRIQAALTLGELEQGQGAKAQDSLDLLARLLKHKDADAVTAGAVAIAAIGPAGSALTGVLKLARSGKAGHRAMAIGALSGVADPGATKAALKALGDDASAVRFAAVAALRTQRTKPVVSALVAALADVDGRLQAELRRALRHLTGADMGELHADWSAWWTTVEATFAFPDLDAKPPEAAKKFKTRPRPKYYGNEIVSQRVAFVVDVSGSMLDKTKPAGSTVEVARLKVCQRELANVINGLERTTRFNLIAFSNAFIKWQRGAVPAQPSRKKQALGFVQSLTASGGTNLFDPLEDALTDPRIDTIWLLSDGDPTAGRFKHAADVLRQVRRLNASRRVAIHTISIGQTSKLLKQLAAEHAGTYHER